MLPAGGAGGPGGNPPGTGDDAPDAQVGRVLQDRYRVDARIAAGGMGAVYRGERLKLGRPVAIKFLQSALAREPKILQRFEVEARAMSRLNHPNCVSVFDFGIEGLPYLVMDLVEGTPLRDVIARGPLPAPRALRITRQVLAALAHAHGHGIIHRDIKPENIILEKTTGIEDHVRILDFGLAKIVGSDMQLTVGMAVGTPNYMAPEQMGEGAIDERVDIYATGVLLFEMLTGKKPFDAPEIGEVFLRQQRMPPPRLRQVLPQSGFSDALEAVLQRAMAKRPADRFPSAAAMTAALETVPEARAGVPAPAVPTAPRTSPAPASSPVDVSLDRTVQETLPGALRAERPSPLAKALLWLRLRPGRMRLAAGAAATLLLLLLSPFLLARRAPPVTVSTPAVAAPAPVAPPAPTPPSADAETELARLRTLRASEPRNPAHAAGLARLYFERRWWSDGIANYRAAIKLDPALKNDPTLVGHVISALQSERADDKAEGFLRELGPAAKPPLREAARSHPSPRVRVRAAELLRSFDRKPFLRWR